MNRTATLMASVSMLLLAGCASTRSDFTTPDLTSGAVASSWAYAEASTTSEALSGRWWERFDDAALNDLVEKVLDSNNDLAAATLRLRRAQLAAGLAANDQRPQFGASGSADVSGDVDGNTVSDSYAARLSVSYEVDLWDRLGALSDAAQWEAVATAEDREATVLSLIGTTANLYFQLGYANERIQLAEQSLASARQIQTLVQARFEAGAESALAVQEARQTVQSQAADLANLTQQRVVTLNAIGVLLGSGTAPQLAFEPRALNVVSLPVVDADAPASLLARRPDLRAAEARLRSTLADVDATRVSFYPTLSLTGSAGGASSSLVNLLSNPAGALASAISLPFLNGAEQRLTNARAEAGYQEAEAGFRQTLVSALADVETALSARTQSALQGDRLAESLDAAQAAERINEVRYRSGAASLREWLDSQERRRSAETAVLSNRQAQLIGHVTLYQALGGDLP